MCTVRCLSLGVRLFEGKFGAIRSRPGISNYFPVASYNHQVYNYGFYRPSTAIKGQFLKRTIENPSHVTCDCIRTDVTGTLQYSTQPTTPPQSEDEPTKMGLYQRYKKMLKEYWYVLIPVHCVTSVVWFGCFYYAATCGVDIVPILEYIGVSETLINPLRSSSLGHLAVASAFYKLATPARYTVTLAGTTLTVKVLTKRGMIKPIPSKQKMKEIVKKKTDDFIQRKTSQQ